MTPPSSHDGSAGSADTAAVLSLVAQLGHHVDLEQDVQGPVGTKSPNPWGLYDMLGNVWDWCWDVYDAEVYGTYRVLRGGGWFDEHWSCRASARRRSHPTFQVDDVGFRVARSIV